LIKFVKRLLGFCFLFLSAVMAWAADPAPDVRAEAPESIFSQKIGDAGVDLQAIGTWDTHFGAGWGEGITPDGTLPGLGYPGYEKGFVFQQIPDFTLTLRLLERYYLQVTYHASLSERSYLVGYDGKPGEFVQWLKLGNSSFGVPARAGQSLPVGAPGAPAAGGAVQWGNTSAEFLVRYEDGSRETMQFRGTRNLSSGSVELTDWIRGRFFRIPGSGPITGVRVLVAQSDTSQTSFREAAPSEASINLSTREVDLASSATRTVLVTWDQASASYPNTSLLGLSYQTQTLTGWGAGPWYILTKPGFLSAFELRNRYPIPSGSTGTILLVNRDTGAPILSSSISSSPTQDWFTVSGDEEAPFENLVPGAYPQGNDGTPPVTSATIPWHFEVAGTPGVNSTLDLGSDVEPSSLIVTRNGIQTQAWSFDPTSGKLSFTIPLFETDLVEVSLQRKVTSPTATDLVLWQGGQWILNSDQDLEWALMGRWNVSKDQLTNQDLQSPGAVSLSLQWKGINGPWQWILGATGGALIADSTGHREIYGQNTPGTEATFDGNALRPSSVPSSGPGTTLASLLGAFQAPAEGNRAPLYFRDYWTNDPVTGQPTVSAWGTPNVNPSPFVDGGWRGPYITQGDGTNNDRIAVLETKLGGGQWAGMDVFLDSGKPLDLRSTTAISIKVRVPNGGLGGAKLLFQAGTLSENFDGTGALRTLSYRTHPALAFQDQTTGFSQYFPIPENSSWANDGNADGVLSDDGTLISLPLDSTTGFDSTNSGWQSIRIVLTASERQLLASATGWRILLLDDGSGLGSKTVLVDSALFEGTTWNVVPDTSAPANSTVSAADEVDASLTQGYHLRVDWSQRSSWTVQNRNTTVRPSSYETLQFQYRLDNPSSTTLTLTFQDADGNGLTATWPATAASSWQTARIDWVNSTMTVDGKATGQVTVTGTSAGWDRMTISQSGASTGLLYLSDVQAVDPRWEPIGSTNAWIQWTQEEGTSSPGLFSITNTVWQARSQHSGVTAADVLWNGWTSVDTNLGPLKTFAEANLTQSARVSEAHGDYEVTLPVVFPGGWSTSWTDRFSDSGLREEKAALTVPWVGTWTADAMATGPPTVLTQGYHLTWTSAASWPEAISGTLAADWVQNSLFTDTLGNFGEQWTQSWSWLRPVDGIAPYIDLSLSPTMKSRWGPISWETSIQNRAVQTVGPTIAWTPQGSWQLQVPFRVDGDQGWGLTPLIRKTVQAVYGPSTARSPSHLVADTLQWLWAPSSLAFLPFAEWGSGPEPWSATDAGFETGTSESTAGLEFDRSNQGLWTDLALPTSGGVEWIADRSAVGQGQGWMSTYSLHGESRALNLFGTVGSQPLLTWYRTDAFTWGVRASLSNGSESTFDKTTLGADQRTEIFLTERESVAVPLSYQGVWSDTPGQTLTISPGWTYKASADLPFPLPGWLSPRRFHREWIQEVSTVFGWGWQPAPAPVFQNLQIQWKGTLLLSPKSQLSLTTKWGQQWQNDLTLIGLEADLDFLLTF